MSSTFHNALYKICDPFKENKSLDEFIECYCKPDSANKCLLTTIGYIRNNSHNSTTPTDITNLIFAFHFGLHTTIHIKYFAHPDGCYSQTITIPLHYSLHDIWKYIQNNFTIKTNNNHESLQSIDTPKFTLCSNLDSPYEISESEYTNKKYFANILHHKLNPIIIWKLNTVNTAAVLLGDNILCVENKLNKVSLYYKIPTKWSTIFINDYTQVTNIHKYNDNIGSSHIANIQLRKIVLKIQKITTLEKFFEIVRDVCKVPANEDIRVFRIYEKEKYLMTFPYKFHCKEHEVMLERGRYPKYTEVFLMVCIINENNTKSKFLPLIINKSEYVKQLKKNIMKLFNLNPLEYKKYICYNITTNVYQKDKCWRNTLTLHSNEINPRHGDRIGIQIGIYSINKKISILKDTRHLNKIFYLSFLYAKLIVFGYIKNIYIQTPMEIKDLIMLFYDHVNYLSKTNNFVNGVLNPYIQQDIGTILVEENCNYNLEELRKQIYNMEQFKNSNIKSHKYLLLSWLDNIYKIPLSFPMLKSGQLNPQKITSPKSIICVEILDEEIELIPKKSRFLHIHFAKIDTNNNDKNVNVLYWPPDYHIRIIYTPDKNINDNKQDKITYKHLSKFICNKYNILFENLLIAMFKVNKGNWILLDDKTDNNKQGLCGPPFYIGCSNRQSQIFVIFDLTKCNIYNIENNTEKILFIKQTINNWGIPPLSNKAKFYYKHFNQPRVE